MMMRQEFGLLPVILMLAFAVGGCNHSETGPTTIPVTGKVTYKGEPLSNATVSFTANGTGKSCDAITNEAGEFSLQTYLPNGDAKAGAVAGEYEVTVIKLDESNLSMSAPPKHLLPVKYSRTKTSGLSASISGAGGQQLLFELK